MSFSFFQHFPDQPALIAMIHVPALPGTPAYGGDWSAVIKKVQREATIYKAAGVDALILENMHDTHYLARAVGPEISSAMTAAALAVRPALKVDGYWANEIDENNLADLITALRSTN